MTPDQFGIFTGLTISSIGAIILLYFIVLKKKGWLTEETSSATSYRCPNPECRKIFQKPITLTDLSQKPPRGYLACPQCGLDLATISMPKLGKANKDDEILLRKKSHISVEDLTTERKSSDFEMSTDFKKPKAQESPHPPFSADASKDFTNSSESAEPKSLAQAPSESIETPRKHADKKATESLRSCTHYFGYVKTLPKNTSIPDECLWCPMIVKCLAGAEQLEA